MVKEEDVAMFELKYWDVLLGGDAKPTQKITYSAYPVYLAVGENDFGRAIEMEDDDRKLSFTEFVTFDGPKEVMREYIIRCFDKWTGKTKKIKIKGIDLVEE